MFNKFNFSNVEEQIQIFKRKHGHPANLFEKNIRKKLNPACRVLDVGCGRSAPLLHKFLNEQVYLFGVDVVDFMKCDRTISLHHASAYNLRHFSTEFFDIVISRSVMEHLEFPEQALQEIYRVLQFGGDFLFLTPNKFDYASFISRIIPNHFHPKIVLLTTGRKEGDTFPTHYKFNSRKDIERISKETGFGISEFEFLYQYPAYLKFNRAAFWFGCQLEEKIFSKKCFESYRGWIQCELTKV